MRRKVFYLLAFVCLAFANTSVQAQVVNPDTSFQQQWSNMQQQGEQLLYEANQIGLEFESGQYSIESFNANTFTSVVDSVTALMKQNKNLTLIVFTFHDQQGFTQQVQSELETLERQGDAKEYLNAKLTELRAVPIARAVLNNGIHYSRVITQGVYQPQDKRSFAFKLVDISSDGAGALAKIEPELAELRNRIGDLERRQGEIGELALSNADKLNNHTDRISRLEQQVDSLANRIESQQTGFLLGGLGLTIGLGASGSDYPDGLNSSRSYLGEITAGINWQERVFLTATYGGSPFSGRMTLPDGPTELHANTRRAALSWLIPSLPIGPIIGWEKSQVVPSEFDGYVTQKSGAFAGLHAHIPLSNRFALSLKGFWTPATLDHWDRVEVDNIPGSARGSIGLMLRLN